MNSLVQISNVTNFISLNRNLLVVAIFLLTVFVYSWFTQSQPKNPVNMILYYSNTCPYSDDSLALWAEFKEYAEQHMKHVKLQSIECNTENQELVNELGISQFPTIMSTDDNTKNKKIFTSERNLKNLISFCS